MSFFITLTSECFFMVEGIAITPRMLWENLKNSFNDQVFITILQRLPEKL